MLLGNLAPRWIRVGHRTGLGISFDCPHCVHAGVTLPERIHVFFANPLDDGAPTPHEHYWQRAGDTFATLTLAPSIDRSEDGHWHGFIVKGEIRS